MTNMGRELSLKVVNSCTYPVCKFNNQIHNLHDFEGAHLNILNEK